MNHRTPTWLTRIARALRREDAPFYSHLAVDVAIDDVCAVLGVRVLDVCRPGTTDALVLLTGGYVAGLLPVNDGDNARWAVYNVGGAAP